MSNYERIAKEKELRQFLTAEKIEHIKLFQVNDYYYDVSKKQHWILDCAIELKFPSGYFSVSWSTNDDSIHFDKKPVNEMYALDNKIELQEGGIQKVKDVVGEQILDVKFKWQEYDVVLDYTMKTEKELRLVEVVLEFSYNRILQIATIGYDLDENNNLIDYEYFVAEGLLLSLAPIQITNESGGVRPKY